MPQFFENAVMTNAGAALLARAMAEGIAIDFVSIAVGNGNYTNAEKAVSALQQRTALKSLKVEYEPSSVIRDSDNAVRISALITNVDPTTQEAIVTAGFYINEIGVMAQPSDESTSPILFSVSVTAGTQGDYMPAYTGDNPAQIIQGYVTAVSNNATVTLTTPVNPYALAADFQALSDAVDTRVADLNSKIVNLEDEVGINLWDEKWEVGAFDASNGKPVPQANAIRTTNFIPVIPLGEYYVCISRGMYIFAYLYDANGAFVSYIGRKDNGEIITIPSNAHFLKFETTSAYGETYINDICINRSNTAINGTYYPYRGLRKQITEVSNEALDIKMLGWSVPKECPVQNYMDADRKFHQRVGRIDLGSLGWNAGTTWFYTTLSNAKIYQSNIIPNAYCYLYKTIKMDDVDTAGDMILSIDNTNHLGIRNNTYTSATAFKTAMQGVYLYYELATEILHREGSEIGESIKGLGNAIVTRGWNQLVQNYHLSGVVVQPGVPYYTNDNYHLIKFIDSHKYLIMSSGNPGGLFFQTDGSQPISSWNGDSIRINTANSSFESSPYLYNYGDEPQTITNAYYNIIDLTELFGAGNEPSSIEYFRAMFPADYYPYYAGEGVDDASGLNLTSSYGTISNVHCVRVGKLVSVSCKVTLTSAISSPVTFLGGLPAPAFDGYPVYVMNGSNWSGLKAQINEGGGVRINESLSSGSVVVVNATYITT